MIVGGNVADHDKSQVQELQASNVRDNENKQYVGISDIHQVTMTHKYMKISRKLFNSSNFLSTF